MRGGGRNTKKKLVKSRISSGPSRALIVTTPFRASDRMQKEIANYVEDSVYYVVKIANYANCKTVAKGIFSHHINSCYEAARFMTK